MKMGNASLFSRLCCGLSLAVLALAASLDGSRAVRAEDADVAPSLQDMIVNPIMNAVHGLEQRLTSAEAKMDSLAESFTSRRVAAQMLCVADESGAQTCITKAQLDALLQVVVHAEIGQPSAVSTEAKALPSEEPIETAVAKDPTPAAVSVDAAEEKAVADQSEHTGTVQAALSAGAIVIYPQVEVTIEPSQVEAIPADPSQPSDN